MGSRDPLPTLFDLFFSFFSLVSPVIYLRAKYEVSSLNRSRDMDGFKNSKSRSRDTIQTRFDLIFNFHRWCLRWSIWVPNLKLLTQSVLEIWRYGVTCTLPTPFDLIFHFFVVSVPGDLSACQIWSFLLKPLEPPVLNLRTKFEVSSSNRSRDVDGFKKSKK